MQEIARRELVAVGLNQHIIQVDYRLASTPFSQGFTGIECVGNIGYYNMHLKNCINEVMGG